MGTLTRTAVLATLHCFTGCAIGEVGGLALGTALGWGTAPTIAVSIALAFVCGCGLSMLLLRAGIPADRAVRLAFASDTVSVMVMELVDNGLILVIPGAMAAGLGDALFWWSLALSLALAFIAALPVNRWLIAGGGGHAIAHPHHHAT